MRPTLLRRRHEPHVGSVDACFVKVTSGEVEVIGMGLLWFYGFLHYIEIPEMNQKYDDFDERD